MYHPIQDYTVEKLLVHGEQQYIPVLKPGDSRRLHVMILGFTDMGWALAECLANICHYPNFDPEHRTRITFIDDDMMYKVQYLSKDLKELFAMSHYDYIKLGENPEARHHDPEGRDILDVEWEFIDTEMDKETTDSIIVAHLRNIDANLISRCTHGKEGTLWFGEDHPAGFKMNKKHEDAAHRFDKAKDVYFIYDQTLPEDERHSDAESAWADLPRPERFECLNCANALSHMARCFDGLEKGPENMAGHDREMLYETEHRRWMMSHLLLGYPADDPRMVPYSELSEKDRLAERVIIDRINDII